MYGRMLEEEDEILPTCSTFLETLDKTRRQSRLTQTIHQLRIACQRASSPSLLILSLFLSLSPFPCSAPGRGHPLGLRVLGLFSALRCRCAQARCRQKAVRSRLLQRLLQGAAQTAPITSPTRAYRYHAHSYTRAEHRRRICEAARIWVFREQRDMNLTVVLW